MFNMSSHYAIYLNTLIHLMTTIILSSYDYYSHFTDEEMETRRSTCPRVTLSKRKVKILSGAQWIPGPFVFSTIRRYILLYKKHGFSFHFHQGA